MKVLVVGAGFAGLTVAHYLEKAGAEVEIWEKEDRSGGILKSRRQAGVLIEASANGLINSKKLEELCYQIDLPILPAKKLSRKRYIYLGGRYRRWPLTTLESFRFLWGYLTLKPPQGEESLADWAKKSFGESALHKLIEPVCFGVFAAPATNLKASLVYKYFFGRKVEQPVHTPRGLVSFPEGLGQLILALENSLQKRKVNIFKSKAATAEVFNGSYKNIVLATNSLTAAGLLQNVSAEAKQVLQSVSYQKTWTVSLVFAERPGFSGFGVLFPASEGFHSLGVLFPQDIFDNRGLSWQETWILTSEKDLSESEVTTRVLEDRGRLFSKLEPKSVFVHFWPEGIPLYDHSIEAVQRLALPKGVHLHGNYLGDIGLGKILERSSELAQKIVAAG